MSRRSTKRPAYTGPAFAPDAPPPGPRPLPPPVDFGDRVPMIVTLGSDLERSRRLADALQRLREAANG